MERVLDTRHGDVWLGAGTLEPAFYSASREAAQTLGLLADRVTFDGRVAGHSPVMWHDQFPMAALWLFNPAGDRSAGRTGP
ncbi:MAG: hypothetical protein FP822_17805 [Brevundimonas sp.]|nr:hypothetical protein [Brevundimonas sp.]